MSMIDFQKEKERLLNTYGIIDKVIEDVERRYDSLGKTISDNEVNEALAEQYRQEYRNLNRAKNNPYFGRIDFKPENREIMNIYVGRTGIMHEAEIVVVDWRAPIASMYYEQRLGKAFYKAPDGKISGEMSLKRQFMIEDRELVSYEDIDVGTSDVYLQRSLSQVSDTRLKNIIATIQAEQNEIIREEINKPIIIQGVAGSGKTTVALHRIAYLIYTYMKQIKAKEILIIAPNRFFLDYISSVLPDLGVDNVKQMTFEMYASELLKSKPTIMSKGLEYEMLMEKQNSIEFMKEFLSFVSSLDFKDIVDKYLGEYEKALFDGKNLALEGVVLISEDEIHSKYASFSSEMSVLEKINNLKSYLTTCLKNILRDYDSFMPSNRVRAFSYATIEFLRKNVTKLVSKYIKELKLGDELIHLRKVYEYIKVNGSFVDNNFAAMMESDFSKRAKKKVVYFEELPALLNIAKKLFGVEKDMIPKYIVIDEAQDFGEYHFGILKEIANTSQITILGDLAQGIFSFSGINDWSNLNQRLFGGQATIQYLTQSYRTTYEIMNEANKVAGKIKKDTDIQLAKPIERCGEKVVYHCAKSEAEELEMIVNRIKTLMKAETRNIAVITADIKSAQKFFHEIAKYIENVNLLINSSEKYLGGITVMPTYLSKGLEFDSVILTDVDDKKYSSSNNNAKLLYVALTRAMHTLDIFFVKKISELME